jgi:hypothetical protein
MKSFTTAIISLIVIISAINVYGSDENSISPEKIAVRFESVLKSKGWNTFIEINSVNARIFNPAYQSLNITIEYNDKGVNIFSITIISKKNSTELRKTFLFNKKNHNSIEQVNAILIPYLISIIDKNVEDRSPFYSSLKLGYYRTNDNKKILPSTKAGILFIDWKFAYDPTRGASESLPLWWGDYLDSSFVLSVNHHGDFINKGEGYTVLDEFSMDINFILYGKSKWDISDQKSSRNLYGLFTSIAYYRPYIQTTMMQWNHDVYTDHIHIQYCYWESIAFMQHLTFINNEKSISFKYRIGIGPNQNSSITLVGIEPYSAMEAERIKHYYTSGWYMKNNQGHRKHNYYYSIAVPVKLEFESDKYFNSKFEFKYHFYYFQSVKTTHLQDFINHIVLNYGYYITNDITAGIGYEFWHTKGRDHEYKNSHWWSRLAIQAEMKI